MFGNPLPGFVCSISYRDVSRACRRKNFAEYTDSCLLALARYPMQDRDLNHYSMTRLKNAIATLSIQAIPQTSTRQLTGKQCINLNSSPIS